MSQTVWVESLGCTKNTVDSEVMLGLLAARGFLKAESAAGADLIIVNTCGFVTSATEESIETILQMADLKTSGNCRKLVVAGCLYQRYKEKLAAELPEVDAFIGCGEINRIADACTAALTGQTYCAACPPEYLYDHETPRAMLFGNGSINVKIAEGCDNRCTYCTIPAIRGRYRSRSLKSVVKEVRSLIYDGAKEINLIAQDTTYFRVPEDGEEQLTALLRELDAIRAKKWVRLMYAHPVRVTHAFARTVEDSRSICRYIDMPIQHISDGILKHMGRSGSSDDVKRSIHILRSEIPELALRTTVMVGFPGETDKHFAELVDFIREVKFDRLGVFKYSREQGTPAAEYKKQIPQRVKEERYETLMREQLVISRRINESLIGKKMEVMIEGVDETDPHFLIGRTYRDAPDVDGIVRVAGKKHTPINSFQPVLITAANDYDLEGKLL